jgi:hypothetical protein
MDTTTLRPAPALLARLRPLRRLAVGGALAVALLGAAAGLAGPAHAAGSADPSGPTESLAVTMSDILISSY